MSKYALIVLISVTILPLGAFLFFRQSQPPPAPAPDVAYLTSTPAVSPGYVDYSPTAYATTASKRRILYFYATWCPTCSVANQDFTANASGIPADVVVFRTDYDSETALKQRYAVTYQHTFVQVDENGNELAKWNGGGLAELLRNLK